jgi:nucleoside-diphosphate-sugar epimerase
MNSNPLHRRNYPSRVATEKTGKRYLIVGGHGLLGSHLVEGLLARGENQICIFDRAASPLFAKEIDSGIVTVHLGDLADLAALRRACSDVDVVFHTAASVNYWYDLPFEYESIHAVNVAGTENVVSACLSEGVRQLIHTSSNIVVVPRNLLEKPLTFADETTPYAKPPFLCHYVSTKILAEQAVLSTNGHGKLLTAALRPGALFGPRDLISRAVRDGMPGVGLTDNAMDYVYIENVIHAFLLLERRLTPGEDIGGKAYFISNYPPDGPRCESYFEFNRRLYAAFGRRFRLAPAPLMSALAWSSRTAVWATRGAAERRLGELRKLRPCTLVLARGTYYFSCKQAQTDFGYKPLYSIEDAVRLTRESWQ